MVASDDVLMSKSSQFAASIAALTRSLPDIRGLGRLYIRCNQLLLKAGHEPMARARMKDGTTILVDLRSQTEVHAFYRGVYDPFLLQSIRALLDPDDLFLDIGANIGFYTVAIAAFLRSRRGMGGVVAFEPLQANHQRLMANLRINRLDDLVCAFQLGLSNCSDRLQIVLREDFLNGSTTGNASISTGSHDFDKGFRTDVIRVRPLDDVWPELKAKLSSRRIGLVKMDIEGHEDQCLEGALKTFASERPILLMEVNKPYYRARGVSLSECFGSHVVPEDYRVYRYQSPSWTLISSLESCAEIDNVFLVPVEKEHCFKDRLVAIRSSRF